MPEPCFLKKSTLFREWVRMIEIKEVKTKKQQREFLNFPLDLYKDNPYFVPLLYSDEKQIFRKDYMYYDQSEAVYYNAYRDGKIVGRISGILQHAANKKWNEKRVRFTRFDAIDDVEVAKALFDAVENWAKQKGMEEVVGPLGFSDMEREGLLIDGFDQLSTYEEQYNYDYYQKLIEYCGYGKDVDWIEHKITVPDGLDPRIESVSSHMMSKYNLHFGEAKNTRDFLKKYKEKIFKIWDETYDKIYGTVPFTDKMKKSLVANFKLLIDMRFVAVILDENEEMVAFAVCFPSIGEAIQPSKGHLTPACIVRVLRAAKNPKIVDMGVIGVVDKYKNKALSAALVARLGKYLVPQIEHFETNLNLENNNPINNMWHWFHDEVHKRRRCFIKKI